jgi:hypothetical protein
MFLRTLVNIDQSKCCYNPEDINLHGHCSENLKSDVESILK